MKVFLVELDTYDLCASFLVGIETAAWISVGMFWVGLGFNLVKVVFLNGQIVIVASGLLCTWIYLTVGAWIWFWLSYVGMMIRGKNEEHCLS